MREPGGRLLFSRITHHESRPPLAFRRFPAIIAAIGCSSGDRHAVRSPLLPCHRGRGPSGRGDGRDPGLAPGRRPGPALREPVFLRARLPRHPPGVPVGPRGAEPIRNRPLHAAAGCGARQCPAVPPAVRPRGVGRRGAHPRSDVPLVQLVDRAFLPPGQRRGELAAGPGRHRGVAELSVLLPLRAREHRWLRARAHDARAVAGRQALAGGWGVRGPGHRDEGVPARAARAPAHPSPPQGARGHVHRAGGRLRGRAVALAGVRGADAPAGQLLRDVGEREHRLHVCLHRRGGAGDGAARRRVHMAGPRRPDLRKPLYVCSLRGLPEARAARRDGGDGLGPDVLPVHGRPAAAGVSLQPGGAPGADPGCVLPLEPLERQALAAGSAGHHPGHRAEPVAGCRALESGGQHHPARHPGARAADGDGGGDVV